MSASQFFVVATQDRAAQYSERIRPNSSTIAKNSCCRCNVYLHARGLVMLSWQGAQLLHFVNMVHSSQLYVEDEPQLGLALLQPLSYLHVLRKHKPEHWGKPGKLATNAPAQLRRQEIRPRCFHTAREGRITPSCLNSNTRCQHVQRKS